MWRCPTCGQTFTGRNMPHSCQTVPLDRHFEGREAMRPVFDALVAAARENGPVTINATKSRITLQAEMRFAAVETRRARLKAHVVLGRRIQSPRFTTVEHLPPAYYVHRFELERPEDVDDEVRAWLAEAYFRRSRAPAAPPAPDPPRPGSR
ncbi:MAG TPA: DUF5655 domain-containing protein [Solirubrobacteraceae bacterium]|nr:DUF5655 domain-containing protein [Solirubrobacteraceae bacterium]